MATGNRKFNTFKVEDLNQETYEEIRKKRKHRRTQSNTTQDLDNMMKTRK